MKKILLIVLLLTSLFLSFSVGFSSTLLQQAETEYERIQNQIEERKAPWIAKVPPVLEYYDINGIDSLEYVFEKWAGERELLVKTDKKERATAQDAFFDSSQSVFKGVGDINLPSRFITTHSPVRDQASHGTCWAFGTTASFESAKLVQEDRKILSDSIFPIDYQDNTYDFSEQFASYHNIDWQIYQNWLFNADTQQSESDPIIQDSAKDNGGNKVFATYNLIRYGIPLETDFPYRKFDFGEYIRWNPTNSNWENNLTRSIKTLIVPKDYDYQYHYASRDDYVNAIKEILIKYGALAVSLQIPNDLYFYRSGVFVPTQRGYTGGHCVALVGWLDIDALKRMGWIPATSESVLINDPNSYSSWEATEFWVIKNSWSSSWGWNGYYIQPIPGEEAYNYGKIQNWMIENDLMTISYFELEERTTEDFDFNDDSIVDQTDYTFLVQQIGTYENPVIYDAIYDCSRPRDGKIDIEDLTSFLKFLNKP